MMEQLLVSVKDIDDRIETIRQMKSKVDGGSETLRSQEIIQLNWIKNLGTYWSPDWLVIETDEISTMLGQIHKASAEARRLSKKFNLLICESKKEQINYVLRKSSCFPTEKIVKTSDEALNPPFYLPYEQLNPKTGDWERVDHWDKPIKNLYKDYHPNNII